MDCTLSNHAKEQGKARNISVEIIDQVINFPGQIIEEEELGQKIYQSIVAFPENRTYLVRVFVSTNEGRTIVKTVYKTSKIDKYDESKVRS
ncbi:DUF4258 domain-containing protein [Spirosoma luteum]|uniref:DUF4258 domain-containing protein n=1 Tax=Spirosoma luteum TaxID=431553 RepID=UPI000365639E|nr:DUF4258 domain-containing protein [Spirosoma luteum]